MDVSKLPTGKAPPQDINVVIEIPQGSSVKYEVDKESGAMVVDRFLFTPMAYPAAYGFIPGTLADDGDPADALVLMPAPVVPGAVVRARPIGMLQMEDESGGDEKIICEITRQMIQHFFERYKDLEPGKWVKVTGWADRAAAEQVIQKSIEAAQK